MNVREDDQLRARLARLDPMPRSTPVDPSTSPRAGERLERLMLTAEPTVPNGRRTPSAQYWRRPVVLAAAGVAAATIGIGALGVINGSTTNPPPVAAQTVLSLKAQDGTTMSSCLPFTLDILRGFPVAFAGTVSAVDGNTVVLDVDRWYRGGTADQVAVTNNAGVVSIGGVEFVKGKRYLVTATDGTVTGCGYSGEANPDLEKLFGQAF